MKSSSSSSSTTTHTVPNKFFLSLDHKITSSLFHHLSNSTSKNPTLFQNIMTTFWKFITFTNDGWIYCILFFSCGYEIYSIHSLESSSPNSEKEIIPYQEYPWILFGFSPLNYMILFFACFFVDLILVGSLKLLWKRIRPVNDHQFLTIHFEQNIKLTNHQVKKHTTFWEVEHGPDQYSFPSGHASRATYILLIFSWKLFYVDHFCDFSLVLIVWMWWFCICISRICLGRHFFFDIVCGILAGTLSFSIALFLSNFVLISTFHSLLSIST